MSNSMCLLSSNNLAVLHTNISAEEEFALATRWQTEGCMKSAEQLVLSHLRYVRYIAKSYSGFGFSKEDLVQEGAIGLMKAVKVFDPNVGVRLISFAIHWIKSEINNYIFRNWSLVRLPNTKSGRKLFFNLSKLKGFKSSLNEKDIESIAEKLSVEKSDVVSMDKRLSTREVTLSPENDDDLGYEYFIADHSAGPEESVIEEMHDAKINKQLHNALHALDERSRDIIQSRWLNGDDKVNLSELAMKYGVSTERIRQIEQLAIKKLGTLMA